MRLPCTILVLLLATSVAIADSVRLRGSASVEAGRAITVGDVAELEGDRASAFADAVLVTDPALRSMGRGWVEVGVDEVRAALSASGARPARLAVSGRVCVVRLLEPVHTEPDDEEPTNDSAAAEAASIDPNGAATVAAEIGRVLAEVLGVDWRAMRVRFDNEDRAFVQSSVVGRKTSVTPLSSAGTRMVVSVRIFVGASLVEQRTVGAEVEVHKPVVVIRRDVARKRAIGAEDLSLVEMWVAPGGSPPVGSIGEATGAVARTRLDAGTVLRVSEIEPPIAVRRGELATVHCLRGGVVLQTRARARRDGRVGEVIEFRVDGSSRAFPARINGPGVAVANLDEQRLASAEDER